MKKAYLYKVILSFIFLLFASCANIVIEFEGPNLDSIENLFLQNIVLPNGLSLDEEISRDTDEYHLKVSIAYSVLNAIPIPNIDNVNITIIKDGIEKEKISDFPLSVGDNLFTIILSKGNLSATYYLNVTKWKQVDNYIKPDIPISNQKFGWHLSMHGDYIAVGAPEETTVAGAKAGAVYIFKQENGDWIQKARIEAPNAGADDQFGHSVYIYNDILLVGAPYEDSDTTGISSDTSLANDAGTNRGAAYLFKRDNSDNWGLMYYIKASDSSDWSVFGWSVALDKNDGETLLVNAPWDSQTAAYSGAVYVFDYLSGTLTQNVKLKADSPVASDVFGGAMYVNNKRIVISAPYRDEGASDAGAIYVFEKNNLGNWIQSTKILASNPDASDYFGFSVVTYEDTILVGAPNEDSNPNLGLMDNSLSDSGIIYEFSLISGNWVETTTFKASNAGAGDQFGWNMDFNNSSVVIGAPKEDGSGVGINPSNNDLATDSGATYIFKKDINGAWEQDAYVKAINTDAGDQFGHSVVIDAGRLLIVASDEQSLDPNDPSNNAGTSAGAVYFYE